MNLGISSKSQNNKPETAVFGANFPEYCLRMAKFSRSRLWRSRLLWNSFAGETREIYGFVSERVWRSFVLNEIRVPLTWFLEMLSNARMSTTFSSTAWTTLASGTQAIAENNLYQCFGFSSTKETCCPTQRVYSCDHSKRNSKFLAKAKWIKAEIYVVSCVYGRTCTERECI